MSTSTSACKLCKRVAGDSDGLCGLCRSIHRLVREFLGLPENLRQWGLGQSRCWCAILQEDVYKQDSRPQKPTPGLTAKAASLCVTAASTPRQGSVKEEPSPSGEEERPREESKPKERERQEGPERARSSGTKRGREPTKRKRSVTRSPPPNSRGRGDRDREERGKEKKRRERSSSIPRRKERTRSPLRPREPRGPPPRDREERGWRPKGQGKGNKEPWYKKWTNKGRQKVERQAQRREDGW